MRWRSRSGGEPTTGLERVLIGLASLAVAIGAIAILSGFFAGRDQAGVSGVHGPGEAFPDQGDLHLRAGELRPVYDSDPPTSGPHIPEPVLTDNVELNDNQLLSALEVGDVVVMYGGPAPPRSLTTFARSAAPPFTPALAATGQALIIGGRPHTTGLIGLAWAHMIRVPTADDAQLHDFVQFWLGRGAPSGR